MDNRFNLTSNCFVINKRNNGDICRRTYEIDKSPNSTDYGSLQLLFLKPLPHRVMIQGLSETHKRDVAQRSYLYTKSFLITAYHTRIWTKVQTTIIP